MLCLTVLRTTDDSTCVLNNYDPTAIDSKWFPKVGTSWGSGLKSPANGLLQSSVLNNTERFSNDDRWSLIWSFFFFSPFFYRCTASRRRPAVSIAMGRTRRISCAGLPSRRTPSSASSWPRRAPTGASSTACCTIPSAKRGTSSSKRSSVSSVLDWSGYRPWSFGLASKASFGLNYLLLRGSLEF